MKIHTEPSNLVGRPVESMQIMLRVVAEGNDRLIPVVPDGIFGRNTMAAVTAFQRYYGLPATGVMNQVTWERLVEVYRHD
ncbi:MAG TPA: peptidoglycan-binding protein, partial [Candidatus Faecousia gallistercoris]|nr:peptidoglycan-binding protein [Candidatus Faecousia gallistercoris]